MNEGKGWNELYFHAQVIQNSITIFILAEDIKFGKDAISRSKIEATKTLRPEYLWADFSKKMIRQTRD